MNQLSVSQARNQMTQLAARLGESQTIEVTNRGKPVLAILPWSLYEALEETIDVLSDEDLQGKLQASIGQLTRGRIIPWTKAKRALHLE
jgi:prevent-host-death family protein